MTFRVSPIHIATVLSIVALPCTAMAEPVKAYFSAKPFKCGYYTYQMEAQLEGDTAQGVNVQIWRKKEGNSSFQGGE